MIGALLEDYLIIAERGKKLEEKCAALFPLRQKWARFL